MEKTFRTLRAILKKHAGHLRVTADTDKLYSLDVGYSARWKKEIYFGGVRLGKSYVSYHLMPVYACPELLKELSPELRKRMQGKSCFNFKTISSDQAAELSELTKRSLQRFAELAQPGTARPTAPPKSRGGRTNRRLSAAADE